MKTITEVEIIKSELKAVIKYELFFINCYLGFSLFVSFFTLTEATLQRRPEAELNTSV